MFCCEFGGHKNRLYLALFDSDISTAQAVDLLGSYGFVSAKENAIMAYVFICIKQTATQLLFARMVHIMFDQMVYNNACKHGSKRLLKYKADLNSRPLYCQNFRFW